MQKYPQNKVVGTTSRPVKTEGYCSDTLHAKRDRKRSEAQARQREHDAHTPEAKRQKCLARRGNSARELERLEGTKA
jgi:hypothetical protein